MQNLWGRIWGSLRRKTALRIGKKLFSDSRSNGQGKKHKKREIGFSLNQSALSTSASAGEKQANKRGSFLGKAGDRAVEVLDTLGSGTPKLNTSSGFVSGMTSRGKKISILAFEVANTVTKGAILFQSLSEENIQYLKKEVLQSEGVQQLISTDMEELISLAEMDKREEFNVFSREVARFGNMCKDPQWHNLNRYFSRLSKAVVVVLGRHREREREREKRKHRTNKEREREAEEGKGREEKRRKKRREREKRMLSVLRTEREAEKEKARRKTTVLVGLSFGEVTTKKEGERQKHKGGKFWFLSNSNLMFQLVASFTSDENKRIPDEVTNFFTGVYRYG